MKYHGQRIEKCDFLLVILFFSSNLGCTSFMERSSPKGPGHS